MIKDGRLIYESGWHWMSWELQNPTLNALVIAVVTTILSYEVSSLVFDLFLGLKVRWEANLSDLHILLLVRKSSPLAICNNVFRQDWLTRLYYKPDIPKDTNIFRGTDRVNPSTVFKLAFLLAAAPVINIVAVVLTLEHEKSITFAESGFGGAAFGASENLSLKSRTLTQFCEETVCKRAYGDELKASFSICSWPNTFHAMGVGGGGGIVSVGVISECEIVIWVGMSGEYVQGVKRAQVYANQSFYLMKHGLTSQTAQELVNIGMERVAQECGLQDSSDAVEFTDQGTSDIQHLYSKVIPCPLQADKRNVSTKILAYLQTHLTIIDAEELYLARTKLFKDKWSGVVAELPFFRGESLLFIARRRRYVSLALLSVIAGLAVAIRLVVKAITNNDVSVGIELFVKSVLGVGCCDSMLEIGHGKVSYNNKYQAGEVAGYGLCRGDLPVVAQFEHGVIGEEATLEGIEKEVC